MTNEIKTPRGEVFFRILVKSALALGVFALIFIVVNFMKSTYLPHTPQMPSCARVQADIRTMATGLETYWIDNGAYPSETWHLTTPIAYLSQLFPDRFSDNGAGPLNYYTDGKGYIIISRGPDRVMQILPERDFHSEENFEADNAFKDTYAPALIEKRYDPSNGTASAGDLFRIGLAATTIKAREALEKENRTNEK